MKRCSKCKCDLELNQFYKDGRNNDGLKRWCKTCSDASRKEWRRRDSRLHNAAAKNYYHRNRDAETAKLRARYRANPEKARAKAREYREANSIRTMLAGARIRAAARGLPFELTEGDIVVPEICPVLGIPLVRQVGLRGDNSPSIDRIDNDGGYVPGNIIVISMRANRLKSDAKPEELARLSEFYS